MTADTIHLIVRDTGEGLYATSPQAPGFAYARSTLAELRADLDEALAFYFDEEGPFQVIEHHEHAQIVSGQEFITRVADDQYRNARLVVADRLGRAVLVADQARALVEAPANQLGEVVYVCAVSTDTVGWLADQLDPRGDALVVAAAIAEQFVFTTTMLAGEGHPGLPTVPLDHDGVSRASTVAELMRTTPIVRPVAHHSIAS